MNIHEYRVLHGLSRKNFGQIVGVSEEFIRLVENGARKLSPERAIGVEEITGGEVGRSDLRPDIWPPAEAAA